MMLERFNTSPRFQAFAPGIGLFLVLLGAIVTAAGVAWMRGGEAEAQALPGSFTIEKSLTSQDGNELVWTVTIVNFSDSSEVVEFVDEYSAPNGAEIISFVFTGAPSPSFCTTVPATSLQCTLMVWEFETAQFTVRTSLPAQGCQNITVANDARLYASADNVTVGQALVIGVLLDEDLNNEFIVQGDPTPCQTPVTPSPSPSPTVCDKCSTPPPTFPPGIIATPIPTNTPIPPPPTPTNTTVPVATQSGGLTDEQRTQTAVAGARTAAALVTPLPPRTGEGSQGAAQTGAMNIGLVFGGLVILAAGLGVLGTRSRKAR